MAVTSFFSVFNTREDSKVNGAHKGIGLMNVKRRLELLYPDAHQLDIDDRPESYSVKLALRINNNNANTLHS